MDRNRVDIVIELYSLQYSLPEGALGEGWRRSFLAARGGFPRDGRKKRTDSSVLLTGGGGFAAGGRSRRGHQFSIHAK